MQFTWIAVYQNMPSFLLIWSCLSPSTSSSHSRLGEPILVTDQAQIVQKGNNVFHWIAHMVSPIIICLIALLNVWTTGVRCSCDDFYEFPRARHLLPCAGLPVGVEERKKRARSEIANERKMPGREKGRASKHLFKNTDPPTTWRNISRVKMSNVKTSKGALMEVFTCSTCLLDSAGAKPNV